MQHKYEILIGESGMYGLSGALKLKYDTIDELLTALADLTDIVLRSGDGVALVVRKAERKDNDINSGVVSISSECGTDAADTGCVG